MREWNLEDLLFEFVTNRRVIENLIQPDEFLKHNAGVFVTKPTHWVPNSYHKRSSWIVKRRIWIVDKPLGDHLKLDEHFAFRKKATEGPYILSAWWEQDSVCMKTRGRKASLGHLLNIFEGLVAMTLWWQVRVHTIRLGAVQIEHLEIERNTESGREQTIY